MTEQRARFTSMIEGTQADWAIIGSHFMGFAAGLSDRVLAHLKLLDGDYGGFPIDRLQHSLQTATRAHRAGESETYVVMALLHDIGDTLGSYNHPDIAAAILKPLRRRQAALDVPEPWRLPRLLFFPPPRNEPRHARGVSWP